MKVDIELFHTTDGGDTMSIQPSASRRQKPNWYVWMKEDGSGILVIDSKKLRAELPANGDAVQFCVDSACSLMNMNRHEFGNGCRLYKK